MLGEFSATIQKLYAAAAGHCTWREALVAIENLTGSTGAVIDLVPMSPGIARKTFSGSFSEENCLEYARDYQAICPRIRHAMSHPSLETQFDYLFMTEAEMDRDPVYDWFGSHGLRYYLGSSLAQTQSYLAFLSLQRSRRQGHADEADVRLFDLLKPHLANATSFADQLGTLRSFDRFSSAVLEALPQAVFALDHERRVRFANTRAQQILESGDGLVTEGGQLRTALPEDQLRLDLLVAGAARTLPAASGGWCRIARPSGKAAYAAFVAPLASEDDEFLAANCEVLVLIHDATQGITVTAEMLISLYGLTEAQARLAGAIAGGHSLESAAARLNMQVATARSHLKAIFAKVGVHRQQDLVRVLTSLSSMHI